MTSIHWEDLFNSENAAIAPSAIAAHLMDKFSQFLFGQFVKKVGFLSL